MDLFPSNYLVPATQYGSDALPEISTGLSSKVASLGEATLGRLDLGEL